MLYRKAYVEEKMKEYRRQRGEELEGEETEEQQQKSKDAVEEEVGDLYELPDHLKPPIDSSSKFCIIICWHGVVFV